MRTKNISEQSSGAAKRSRFLKMKMRRAKMRRNEIAAKAPEFYQRVFFHALARTRELAEAKIRPMSVNSGLMQAV
jgi:hypothetical protein